MTNNNKVTIINILKPLDLRIAKTYTQQHKLEKKRYTSSASKT